MKSQANIYDQTETPTIDNIQPRTAVSSRFNYLHFPFSIAQQHEAKCYLATQCHPRRSLNRHIAPLHATDAVRCRSSTKQALTGKGLLLRQVQVRIGSSGEETPESISGPGDASPAATIKPPSTASA